MKDKDEFLKEMENLHVPDIKPGAHPRKVKIAIMNADRSAALGVWLIAVPSYFLFCVFMYYYFHIHLGIFVAMFNLMAALDNNRYIGFLGPLLLVGLPIISIIINTLAIINVQYQVFSREVKRVNELAITIKLKLWNIVLILISLCIIGIFIAYVIAENIIIKH